MKCEPLIAELYKTQYPGVVVRGYHCPGMQQMYRNTIYINKTVPDNLICGMIGYSYEEVLKTFSKKVQ